LAVSLLTGSPTELAGLPEGIALIRSILTAPELTEWTELIARKYEKLEVARREGPAALGKFIPPGQRFVPTVSSLTLGAVLAQDAVVAWLGKLCQSEAGGWIKAELGSSVQCDLDQAWIRRQYAPGRYPVWHTPHGWHQDGALGFDFMAHADGILPPDAILQMVTCWIPVVPCGVHAPGLELVTRRVEALFSPERLRPDQLETRFAASEFWRPALEPGDALLFRGDVLHRTHVNPGMTSDRTSIEFRFFANPPARLKQDRFVRLTCMPSSPYGSS
jgi:hypothetical protein